jgi:hypothetical protein
MKEQRTNKNVIKEKAYDFALSIITLYKSMKLQNELVCQNITKKQLTEIIGIHN